MGCKSSHAFCTDAESPKGKVKNVHQQRSLWPTRHFIHDASLPCRWTTKKEKSGASVSWTINDLIRTHACSWLRLFALTQGHSCPNPSMSTRLSAFRPAVTPLLAPGIPSSLLVPTNLSNLVQFELVFATMLCKIVSNLRILYFYSCRWRLQCVESWNREMTAGEGYV